MESLKYCDAFHSNAILQHFFDMQKLNLMCDMTLIVENNEINVHMLVLAAVSPYFSTLSNSAFKETIDNKVKFDDIDKTTLEQIIHFMYTGEIEINEDNVYQIMEVASRFQLSAMKLPVSHFLVSSLKTTSCMKTLAYAHLYDYEELVYQTLKFISANIVFIIGKETFQTAPAEIVKLALCQRNLHSSNILRGMEKWLRRNCKNDIFRRHNCLTFENFDYFSRIMADGNNTQISNLLEAVSKFVSKYYYEKCNIWLKEDVHLKEHQIILSIGGTSRGRIYSTSESYYNSWTLSLPFFSSPEVDVLDLCFENEVSVIPTMSIPRMCFAVAQSIHLPDVVYVIGGLGTASYGRALNSCEKYDASSNSWSLLKEMPKKLKYHAAAYLEGKIMVMGGETETGDVVSDVLEYCPKYNRWQMGTPMLQPRVGHSAVNVLGQLFVLGGRSGITNLLLASVERYNSDLKSWTTISYLPEFKYEFGCVAVNEYIYVIGGANKHFVLKSVHRYNTIKNDWERCEDMPVPKSCFGCTVRNDRIYCVGGSDIVHGPLTSVEIYNPQTNRWHYSSDKLQTPRSYSCAATVKIFCRETEEKM